MAYIQKDNSITLSIIGSGNIASALALRFTVVPERANKTTWAGRIVIDATNAIDEHLGLGLRLWELGIAAGWPGTAGHE